VTKLSDGMGHVRNVFLYVCKLVAFRWRKDLPKLQAGLDAGPLLIFNKSGSVLVISALDNFMAASYEHNTNSLAVSWGIMGKVDSVTKGFQYSTIMYYGASGINKVICCPCDVPFLVTL